MKQDSSLQVSSYLFKTKKAVFSFHTLGGCFRFRGLSPIRPSFPGTLQRQGLLLVHHDVVHSLISHTAARTTALLLTWWRGLPRIQVKIEVFHLLVSFGFDHRTASPIETVTAEKNRVFAGQVGIHGDVVLLAVVRIAARGCAMHGVRPGGQREPGGVSSKTPGDGRSNWGL